VIQDEEAERSLEAACAKRPSGVAVPGWGKVLRLLRHEITHSRSPRIRLDARPSEPKNQPVLIRECRVIAIPTAKDEVSFDSPE
jgi:hypothetical protein